MITERIVGEYNKHSLSLLPLVSSRSLIVLLKYICICLEIKKNKKTLILQPLSVVSSSSYRLRFVLNTTF